MIPRSLFTTSVAYPWALVLWGGSTPGARPSTRLAFLQKAVADGQGVILHYKGITCSGAWPNRWNKTSLKFENSDIIKCWRYRPTTQQIRRCKKQLLAR